MTLPLFLTLSACKGPAPLSGPPPVSDQTDMLLQAVTTEQNLIWIYDKAAAAHPRLAPMLAALLAEHEAHLAQLRDRVIEPPGKHVPAAVTAWAGGRKPKVGTTQVAALTQLRAAEQAAITALLTRLGGASPSLAQLYASIAASEATHVTALTHQIGP